MIGLRKVVLLVVRYLVFFVIDVNFIKENDRWYMVVGKMLVCMMNFILF